MVCFKISVLFYQSICLSFCQHWAALLTAAFTKSWHLVLSALFFKDALIILGPLHFHIHFRIRLSISKQPTRKEKPAGILVGITWNLETSAGRTDHLYNAKCRWVCGGRTRLLHCWWACQLVPSLENRQPSTEAEHMPPLWPGNSIPRYEPNRTHTHTHRKTCVRMLMAAVFRITQNGW